MPVSLLPGLSGASGAEGPDGPQAARSSSVIAAARTAAVHRFQSFICGPSLSSYGSALLPSFILSPAAARCQWADAPNFAGKFRQSVQKQEHFKIASAWSEPKELYRSNVLEYISYMRNIRGYSPKSVNNHLSALRCLNKYLVQSGRQSDMAVLDSDFMKVQIQYASPCSVDKKEVEAFRQRMLESGSKRDFAIVTLLVYAGLRRSECVDLKLNQVDLVAKEIRVIGKGDKQRLVYINDRIATAIREYLKERNADSPYLFASRQCAKLSASRINQIFNKYSDTITPKTLRHFFCSNALENGYSIHEVANQAGHSNVQTTLIYSNPSAKQMKEKANKL